MDVSAFMGGSGVTHEHLPQPFQNWTISKVEMRTFGTDNKVSLIFNEFPSLPWGMPPTMVKRLASLFGTTDGNLWIGRQLVVYRSRVAYQGKLLFCVRANDPAIGPGVDHLGQPEQIFDRDGTFVQYVPPQVPQQPAPAAPQPVAPQPMQQQAYQPPPAMPAQVAEQAPIAPPAAAPQPQRPNSDPWQGQEPVAPPQQQPQPVAAPVPQNSPPAQS